MNIIGEPKSRNVFLLDTAQKGDGQDLPGSMRLNVATHHRVNLMKDGDARSWRMKKVSLVSLCTVGDEVVFDMCRMYTSMKWSIAHEL